MTIKENIREEEKLRKIAPAENPFRLPEGYFDQLPDTIMQRIQAPKQPHQSRWHRWAIAAVLVGLVSGISAVLYTSQGTTEQMPVAANAQQTSSINNDALDYAMVDNNEIEYYLTEAQQN